MSSSNWLLTVTDYHGSYNTMFEDGGNDVGYALWQVESCYEKYDDYVEAFVHFRFPKSLAEVQDIYPLGAQWTIASDPNVVFGNRYLIEGPWEVGVRILRPKLPRLHMVHVEDWTPLVPEGHDFNLVPGATNNNTDLNIVPKNYSVNAASVIPREMDPNFINRVKEFNYLTK